MLVIVDLVDHWNTVDNVVVEVREEQEETERAEHDVGFPLQALVRQRRVVRNDIPHKVLAHFHKEKQGNRKDEEEE